MYLKKQKFHNPASKTPRLIINVPLVPSSSYWHTALQAPLNNSSRYKNNPFRVSTTNGTRREYLVVTITHFFPGNRKDLQQKNLKGGSTDPCGALWIKWMKTSRRWNSTKNTKKATFERSLIEKVGQLYDQEIDSKPASSTRMWIYGRLLFKRAFINYILSLYLECVGDLEPFQKTLFLTKLTRSRSI